MRVALLALVLGGCANLLGVGDVRAVDDAATVADSAEPDASPPDGRAPDAGTADAKLPAPDASPPDAGLFCPARDSADSASTGWNVQCADVVSAGCPFCVVSRDFPSGTATDTFSGPCCWFTGCGISPCQTP